MDEEGQGGRKRGLWREVLGRRAGEGRGRRVNNEGGTVVPLPERIYGFTKQAPPNLP